LINIYPAESRFKTDLDWLTSRPSFSMADHYDPDNTGFGVLKVFNCDIIRGGRGFGAHPHREMEIVSIVLEGELKHEDSTGRTAVTGFGGVQRMSAGTGIIHSEVNPGDADCKLLQIWFTPSVRGLEPSYETSEYDTDAMKGRLLPVVSQGGGDGIASIHQDLTIYLARLAPGQTIRHRQRSGRRMYAFVIEGGMLLGSGESLNEEDAARIEELDELEMTAAASGAMVLLIDLP